ncbi:serine/threonine-protein kinase VRK2 isoform X2 [Electrophorus electricus]|uniref:serine/threonine-protein kinase VRK2 isoform X2 n=1 Tax=Electrophorus electricus TaxID=8005 RepID=UPI0015D076C8|nr:serine/threonine-protein kinase VRK2 isoform X2 [Electrophorus electricus]
MAPKMRALPRPLPDGFILTDTEKKKWRLGQIIGTGGFAQIYSASRYPATAAREDTDYVIKVEYHENGSLFTELKFYQRAAKTDSINTWKRRKGLDFLGIPKYWGSGYCDHDGKRYRFMVMDRLGTDLQKVFLENGEQMRKETVLQLGCLILDVLEYIHENEYVHADIKAANLLLGHRDPDKVYLVDYGLSYRYCPNGEHKDYKENPKKGHNGTIEYTSLDAHKGVAPSRRGDLEVLGYCLLHWQHGTLPWLSVLRNPAQVQEAKAKLIANLPDSVIQMSPSNCTLVDVAEFLCSVKALGYNEKPDYQALRKVLSATRSQSPLDLSRPRAVETARPAANRNSSHARAAVRSTRRKPVAKDEDGNWDKVDSKPARVGSRTKGESKTQEQKQCRSNLSAKGATKSSLVARGSDEGYIDDPLPSRMQPKPQGTKQRQKHEQLAPGPGVTRRTDEAWLPTKKQPNDPDLGHSFSSDVRKNWGRNCNSWKYSTRLSEEGAYWDELNQNPNHWVETNHSGHQWRRAAYEYNNDKYWNNSEKSENEQHMQWSLKMCIGIIIGLLLILVVGTVR